MPPDKKKNIVYMILSGVGFSGLTWGLMVVFNTGQFVQKAKATTSTVSDIVRRMDDHDIKDDERHEKQQNINDQNYAVQNSMLLQLKDISYQLRRRNDIDSMRNSIDKKPQNQQQHGSR